MSESSGRVEAIWLKRGKRAPMDATPTVQAIAGSGLEGNANRGGKRQVTLLSADTWADVERELGLQLDPRLRRANIYVSGVVLEGSRGRTLQIGRCRIRINGETRPCNQMEEAQPGLQAALDPDWRGGAYGEVLVDAPISVGDRASWLDD